LAFKPSRSLQISVNAFALVCLLWGLQKYLVPTAVFFIGDTEEAEYMMLHEAGSSFGRFSILAIFGVIMPLPSIEKWSERITFNQASISELGILGMLGVVLFIALLIRSCARLYADSARRKFLAALAATVVGQIFLHQVYGDDLFL
jgi:hypothetical protein